MFRRVFILAALMSMPAAAAAGQSTNHDVVLGPRTRAQGVPAAAASSIGRQVDALLINGVHVLGTIVEAGPDALVIRTPNGVVRIPRANLRSATLLPGLRTPSPAPSTAAPKADAPAADVSTPLLGLAAPQSTRVGAPAGLALLGQHAVNQSLSFGIMPILPIGIFANVSYHARLTPTTAIGASVVHMESFFGRGGIVSATVTTHDRRSTFMGGVNAIYGSGGYFQPAVTGAYSRQLSDQVSVATMGTVSTHSGTLMGLVGIGKRPMRANVGAMVTRTPVGQTFVRPIVMFGLQF